MAVTIFGRTYQLQGEEDAAYLERLAAIVDRKMSEVAEATGTADTLKVAILASLNIVDDYLKAGGPATDGSPELGSRITQLVARLDAALASSESTGAC